MPKFIVVPADALKNLALAEVNVSNPSDAVSAVNPAVALPNRVAIVPCDSITQVLVMDRTDTDVMVIQRDTGVSEVVPAALPPRQNLLPDGTLDMVDPDESPFEEPLGETQE